MSPAITAKELISKGVSAFEEALAQNSSAVISVKGKDRFVVMPIEDYQYLKECEIEAALARTRTDLSRGRFVSSSLEEHLERIESDIET